MYLVFASYCVVVDKIPGCESDATAGDNTHEHTEDSAKRSCSGCSLFFLSSFIQPF